MAYDGDILDYCPAIAFDFSRAYAVVVSGDRWNPCGHMLANTGGIGGWYFHVAGEFRGFPRYMGEAGFRRYIREHRKTVISRTRVALTNPDASMLRLEQLLAGKWTWFVLPNNCAHFVEEVFQAGGTDAGLWTNCPTRETFR